MAITFNGREFSRGIHTHLCREAPEPILGVSCRRRTLPIDLIVIHYTAGEGSAEQVFRVLENRKLSIHFVIDRAGVIHQSCDPARVTAYHAGKANGRSIGIEIVNYGARRPFSRPWNIIDAPSVARDRVVYEAFVGSQRLYFADLYVSQRLACIDLVSLLCECADIPKKVPQTLGNAPVHDRFDVHEFHGFKGVCGHYHLSRNKIDPGPAIIEDIHSEFRKQKTK